jgi:hypothetical protein
MVTGKRSRRQITNGRVVEAGKERIFSQRNRFLVPGCQFSVVRTARVHFPNCRGGTLCPMSPGARRDRESIRPSAHQWKPKGWADLLADEKPGSGFDYSTEISRYVSVLHHRKGIRGAQYFRLMVLRARS